MTNEKDNDPPYEPDQWTSKADYDLWIELGKKRREEKRIFNRAVENDPTIKIHVWDTVVHPKEEVRTAWLRPGNAFTEKSFRLTPGCATPPDEILAAEKEQGINTEPYLKTALLVNNLGSDEPDYPKKVKAMVCDIFQLPDEEITLIVHSEFRSLDREHNAFGVK
jgi:hypothetical protein